MKLGKLILFGLVLAALAFGDSAYSADAAARLHGQIVVAKVEGAVTASPKACGDKRILKEGDVISDQYDVETGEGALAILTFSNGATVDLAANSELDIQQFEQDPFTGTLKASDLRAEPSTSVTRLNLVKGDLVGKVVHLNVDRGSEFVVNTPVGAAGIRGTVFRIIFRPTADGQARFSVVTTEGVVVFRGLTSGPVSIPAGREVTATVSYTPPSPNNPTATVSTPVIVSTTGASTTEISEIQAAAQAIVESLSNVTIPPPAGNGQNGNKNPTNPAPQSNTSPIIQPINPTVVSPSS